MSVPRVVADPSSPRARKGKGKGKTKRQRKRRTASAAVAEGRADAANDVRPDDVAGAQGIPSGDQAVNPPDAPNAGTAADSGTAQEAVSAQVLLTNHQKLIDDSAISPEVAAERGYRSVTSRAELGRLGFGDKQCRVPALLLPIYGVNGEIVLYQARPDMPRVMDRGKAIKYETPRGSRMVLDVPPRVRPMLADPKQPLFVTEGIRKADSAASIGLACVALLGVWNWRGTNDAGGKVALPDWESIALNDRDVYIVFDSDAVTKPEVQSALRRFARFLMNRQAKVKIVSLPSEPNGTKVGLDDYLAAGHGIDDLVQHAKLEPIGKETREDADSLYEESEGGLVWNRMTSNGPVSVRLTNFTAKILADIGRDDGVETTRMFEVEARRGPRVTRFSVPASRFSAMNWPTEHLGAEAVIFPGQSLRDHTRVAIQILSGDVPRRTVFTHTGWRTVDDRLVYLHGGGAIGRNGQVPGVEVELPASLRGMVLPDSPVGEGLKAAVVASLDLLQLAPDRISVPLMAATYRSVLGGTDSSLHLSGPTGAGKSEFAARCMQHFGAGFNRTTLPGSWSSTGNSLEVLAFLAKDALLVVDDFCPTGSSTDVQRTHREADRLLRAQGNNSGRGRLSSDGTLRGSRPPRGTIISTGEDVPRGQSLRARMLMIGVGPNDIDFDVLTGAQKAGEKGIYAAAMAGYLKWLAPRYEAIRRSMPDEINAIRAAASVNGQHRRVPSIVADLYFGFRTFVTFAVEVGAISTTVEDALLDRAWTAFLEVAHEQAEHQASAEPTARFLELLRSALAAGAAHVASFDGAAPEDPGAWGWRERTVGAGANERAEWHAQGRRVGWIDDVGVYLDRDSAYQACQAAAGGGEGLPISMATLTKRLHERGLLASTDGTRKSLLVRRVIENYRRNVLHIAREAVYPSHELPNLPTTMEAPANAEDATGNSCGEGRPPAHGLAQELAHARPAVGNSVGNGANGGSRLAQSNCLPNQELEPAGQIGQEAQRGDAPAESGGGRSGLSSKECVNRDLGLEGGKAPAQRWKGQDEHFD